VSKGTLGLIRRDIPFGNTHRISNDSLDRSSFAPLVRTTAHRVSSCSLHFWRVLWRSKEAPIIPVLGIPSFTVERPTIDRPIVEDAGGEGRSRAGRIVAKSRITVKLIILDASTVNSSPIASFGLMTHLCDLSPVSRRKWRRDGLRPRIRGRRWSRRLVGCCHCRFDRLLRWLGRILRSRR